MGHALDTDGLVTATDEFIVDWIVVTRGSDRVRFGVNGQAGFHECAAAEAPELGDVIRSTLTLRRVRLQ